MRKHGRGETEKDVTDAKKTRHERRGIAQRDHDNMRRKPEIRIQHRLKHDHRIAAQRQIMRDYERNKSGERADRRAKPETINSLQENAENHRPPADENRRGIKIRY